MVAGVAVDDVGEVNLVEEPLLSVGAVDADDAGVEAAAQDRHDALRPKTLLVGPLPRVAELRLVAGLVIGRVEIVDARRQTGVHDREILVRQRQVDDNVRPYALDERHHL